MKELNTVNLTANQKRVIAKIIASPTPKVAGQEISGDQNLVAAHNELARLGAIKSVGGEVSLTDIGQRLSQEDNIADVSGQLTPDGQALAYTDASGKEDKDMTQQPPTTLPAGMAQGSPGTLTPQPTGDMGNLTMSNTPSYEPLQLLRELMEHALIVEPGGEMKSFFPTPHKQLQDLVKALKAQGHSREDIIHHIQRHKELRMPPVEDEQVTMMDRYDRAFVKGRHAYTDGKDTKENPYHVDTTEYKGWVKGWFAAWNLAGQKEPTPRPVEDEQETKKAGTGRLFTIDEVRARARAEKAKAAPRKPSTPEQRERARGRHWKKTGVSDVTIQWMKKSGML